MIVEISTLTVQEARNVLTFINSYHGERVRQVSLDEARQHLQHDVRYNEEDQRYLAVEVSLTGGLRGVTFATNYKDAPSFTIVHPDHRSQGIGSSLVAAKANARPWWLGRVARDNLAGVRMFIKAHLVPVEVGHGQRKSGAYTYQVWARSDAE